VSFPHLALIFLIALLVLGPQKMPGLVAQVGRWAGKARAMARQFREQLESEINLEELNRTASQPKTPPPDTLHPTPWSPSPTATEQAAAEPPPSPVADAAAEAPVATAADGASTQAAVAVENAPAPAWVSDVHDNRLHPPAPPETHSPTPMIETHERGA
jgi:sec-independent protein translocase protein TatB